MADGPPRVALFVTCLVDQFAPEVARATQRVLERVGVAAAVPADQTCCGQPLLNDGFPDQAAQLARRWMQTFEPFDAVVTPSGSCATTVREFYPQLLATDPWAGRVRAVAHRTYELSEFLVRVLRVEDVGARFPHRVAFHASCHLLRNCGAADCARALLRRVTGLQLVELAHPEACCGFGGLFCVKFPEVSEAMLRDKLHDAASTAAEALVSTDLGCLLHLAGGGSRQRIALRCLHLAEVLGGL
ncbi:MAG: (Fe-S)-binding protein [Armatimonadota bacterium]|nr:(Fe-S)-binding protein [Armatimonadota bacterium]MDR7426331.1 (Fe-S)-binding protein [Armatimonadota bacterium]MDR7463242.1 (Fe-S)-binding protein [Armatimonadota bacterium]MDR7469185.1 (Fe-S)-binding protein [Armatimonadota bacterium]MDR7474544.1 (Fe-S)-binding protein [Armatimonadota bacterium]